MQVDNIKLGFFVPCSVDQFASETAMRAFKLLRRLVPDCRFPEEMTCCGKELYNNGDRDGAKILGERMIEMYEDCTHVVSCGSGCVAYIQNQFKKLYHNTTLHNSYRQFVDKCYDLSDFLVNVLHYSPAGVKFEHSVAVLDHCGTQNDYFCAAHPDKSGLHDEVRQLLGGVEGLHLVEVEQADVCCGYGGHFASMFTAISDSLAKRKVENAIAAGADVLVSTEMSCLLHLRSYVDKNGLPLCCLHLADILAPMGD